MTGVSSTSWYASPRASASRSGSSRSRSRPPAAADAAAWRGRDLILLDARASLGDRVAALASALAGLDLDDVYVTPEARDRVEAERDAGSRPRGAVPLAPRSTMGVGGPARCYVEARDEATVLAALDWAERRGAAGARARRRLEPGRRGCGSRRARPADRPPGRDGARGGRRRSSSPRPRASRGTTWSRLRRRARVGGARVPERHSRARRRHAHPERRRLRTGGRARRSPPCAPSTARRGTVVSLDARRLRVRLPRQRRSRAACRTATSILARDLPTPAGRGAGRPLRRRRAAPRGARDRLRRPSRTCGQACSTIRRAKSMVLDPRDPNRRSCGSFFVNPVVPTAEAERIAAAAGDPAMPRWPEPGGRG